MNVHGARHIARHVCWYKAARTIESAAYELAVRLGEGDLSAGVYRCPFSPPGEAGHYHLTTGDRNGSEGKIAAALTALGPDAYRSKLTGPITTPNQQHVSAAGSAVPTHPQKEHDGQAE